MSPAPLRAVRHDVTVTQSQTAGSNRSPLASGRKARASLDRAARPGRARRAPNPRLVCVRRERTPAAGRDVCIERAMRARRQQQARFHNTQSYPDAGRVRLARDERGPMRQVFVFEKVRGDRRAVERTGGAAGARGAGRGAAAGRRTGARISVRRPSAWSSIRRSSAPTSSIRSNAPPGNLRSAHFHPHFDGIEPCDRFWRRRSSRIPPVGWQRSSATCPDCSSAAA
jgi:hypothetical protein